MPDNQATNCFIDTNIWLYAFIEGDDTTKSGIARTLIQQSEPVVSAQVIKELGLKPRPLGRLCAKLKVAG